MTWNDITVEQYQAIYKLIQTDLDPLDKLSELIALLYNMTAYEVDELPTRKYNELARSVEFVLTEQPPITKAPKYINVGAKRFKVQYDASKLNQRQFSEVSYFNNNEPIANMHNLLASLVQPVKFGIALKNKKEHHSKYAAALLKAKIVDVNSACVFFCNLYKSYLNAIGDYLNKMQQPQAAQLLRSLAEFMDGLTIPLPSQRSNAAH